MGDGSFRLVVGWKMAVAILLWDGRWQFPFDCGMGYGSFHLVKGWEMAVSI